MVQDTQNGLKSGKKICKKKFSSMFFFDFQIVITLEPKVVDPYNLGDSWSVDRGLSSGKWMPFSAGRGGVCQSVQGKNRQKCSHLTLAVVYTAYKCQSIGHQLWRLFLSCSQLLKGFKLLLRAVLNTINTMVKYFEIPSSLVFMTSRNR